MSFRFKFFSILGLSQVLLTLILTGAFVILVDKVKNEPQDKRAMEQAVQFKRELQFKEEKLNLFLSEIKRNQSLNSILMQGLYNRNILLYNLPLYQNLMKEHGISIFEIGDPAGKVYFRFHRPADFGDDKSGQALIINALQGKTASAMESGHSGLGLRLAAPFQSFTILIGHKVDDSFAAQIVGHESTQIAIFDKEILKAKSSKSVETFINTHGGINKIQNHSREKIENKFYYIIKLPYESHGLTKLNLEFLVLIDETDLQVATQQVWSYFILIIVLLTGVIFLVSFLFARDIIKAVKALNFAMANIDKDETSIVDLTRRDEIGQMASVFVQMKADLVNYQFHLQDLVNRKTDELQKTLNEIKELKMHQDGDYFLTSLLLKPLNNGNLHSDTVKIESLIRQKKVFNFRNKTAEIGGDLCLADEIVLRNEEYLVFVNADAMGKSLQGASGAIVMGTVFKSILQNTSDIRALQDKTPERWLRDCYNELHNVFLTFDGSMLVSAIIGVVHKKNGTLYYLNAEHPYVILYRNGIASFIDQDFYLRKIGVESESNQIKIHVIQLDPDDVIIIGSDGRDDILIPGENTSLMNEDEREILSHIEAGKGSLDKIQDSLLNRGEITDDLTLMRISFHPELKPLILSEEEDFQQRRLRKEAIHEYREGKINRAIELLELLHESHPQDLYTMRELFKLYLKNRQFEKAIPYCEKYLEQRPSDTEMYFLSSFAYKQIHDYEKAIDNGERVVLREPWHFKNLVNLSETYFLSKNASKGKVYLTAAEKIAPQHKLIEHLTEVYCNF